jgi:hypothetical protein
MFRSKEMSGGIEMTISEPTKRISASAAANIFDESDFPANDTGFPFGANAPQDTQDFQDFQDSQGNSKTNNDFSRTNFENILSQPLAIYLRQVFEYSEMLKEDDKESWHSPVFFFARFCKAHPSIIDLPDHKAMQAVEKVMHTWDDLPRDRDPWEYYFDSGDADSAQIDFMNSWNSIRHIPFHDPLQNALRLAGQHPLKAAYERGNLYDRFISLAGWLQRLMHGKDIYLPTRTIAELLNCDQRTVSRLRRLAMRDGLLTIVKEHTFRSGGKSEATVFQFAIERFDALRDGE